MEQTAGAHGICSAKALFRSLCSAVQTTRAAMHVDSTEVKCGASAQQTLTS